MVRTVYGYSAPHICRRQGAARSRCDVLDRALESIWPLGLGPCGFGIIRYQPPEALARRLAYIKDRPAAAEGFLRIINLNIQLMATTIIIVAIACALGYFLRCNFRRAWYVLRTGDAHPDFDKLGEKYGEEYFEADWEKWIWNRFAKKDNAKTPPDVQK